MKELPFLHSARRLMLVDICNNNNNKDFISRG